MERDEQEIRELVARWMAATKAGDIQSVLSLMAEDVVFLVPGQAPMIGKAAYASASKAQEPVQFDGTSEIVFFGTADRWGDCCRLKPGHPSRVDKRNAGGIVQDHRLALENAVLRVDRSKELAPAGHVFRRSQKQVSRWTEGVVEQR